MNDAVNVQQPNYPGTSHNYLNQTVPIIFLLIILFFAAWVRFDGITEQGISSGDSFNYLKEAKLWVDGQPPKFMGKIYRPATYFLQEMAIIIFGYNDYSVMILHGFMDMISILLIFLIAAKLAKNLWVGVVGSLLYAFLPNVISLTRCGLGHVESTTFVLLALFFFILFDNQEKKGFKLYFLLFLSGINSGLAANTHPDLAFLAPGYVLYLFIKSYDSQNKSESLKEFLILAFMFTFSFFTPYLLGFFLFGPEKVIQVFFKEISSAKSNVPATLGYASKPAIFFSILYLLIKIYFKKQFLLIGVLLIGTIFIMIYRKMKKERDPLMLYFPLILIFSYAFFHSCFLNSSIPPRILMPLLPLVIFILTQWYDKIFKQLLGKYSLIVFICLFFMLFLLNPKVMPGKIKFKSPYRLVYDILKDDVNPGNKLLIAPVSIYSKDRGYQSDLYFGKSAIYLVHLPIKDEYNLESLKELLKGTNIRYVFLGKKIDHRFIKKDFPMRESHKRWLRNDKISYSLEKDLEIIEAYIQSRGGMLINKNRAGKIYYLSEDEEKSGLIANGSFEHWWKGFPIGEWRLVNGRISKSGEATVGSSSIRFETDDNKGTRIVWVFGKPLPENGSELKVRLDVKVGKLDKFFFFFNAEIDGKRKAINPGIVRYTGGGDWVTLSKDFAITPDMRTLIFHLWLRAGAREPAFVDNLSIELF